MTLGEKIYKLRTKRSMTQEQLAEKIGVSRQSVSKWETDSAIPDILNLFTQSTNMYIYCADISGIIIAPYGI